MRERLPLKAGWMSGELPLLPFNGRRARLSRGGPDSSNAARQKFCVVLAIEKGHVVGERRFPVVLTSSIGGLCVSHEDREFRGVAGDDSYWGMSLLREFVPPDPACVTSPLRSTLRIQIGDIKSKGSLFDDASDVWGLRAGLQL